MSEQGIKGQLTKEEFAARCGMSVSTLKRLMKERQVSYIKRPGGHVRFLERHVDEYFKRFEKKARAA